MKAKKSAETRILVGTYHFSLYYVDLYLNTQLLGGSFNCRPEGSNRAIIEVGGLGEWREVMSALVHEAMELAFLETGCRFTVDGVGIAGRDMYSFIADHPKFSEACNRTGLFLSECVVPLKKAYEKTL